jgi:hypothetical protein
VVHKLIEAERKKFFIPVIGIKKGDSPDALKGECFKECLGVTAITLRYGDYFTNPGLENNSVYALNPGADISRESVKLRLFEKILVCLIRNEAIIEINRVFLC